MAIAVLALATAGFFVLIPLHRIHDARMSMLAPSSPPRGLDAKPAIASPERTSTFAAVTAAAKKDPGSTGTYTVEWTKPLPAAPGAASNSGGNDTVTLVLSLLPTPAQADTTQKEALSAYLGPKSKQSQYYKLASTVAVRFPPGARESWFEPTTAAPPLAVEAFAYNRAQVVVFSAVEESSPTGGPSKAAPASPAAAESAAEAAASSEYRLLARRLAGFSLRTTTWPLTATAVYWAVTAALAAAVVFVPVAVRKSREHRRRAREQARRRQLQSRGAKIARRQATRAR
jgi:hypothetical protein